MNSQLSNELKTERLILRRLRMEDAPDIERLAGAREVAATTLLIPHPYAAADAEKWILNSQRNAANRLAFTFAITLAETGEFIGGIGIGIEKEHNRAEMGYWIGVPYWGRGYATEAGTRLLQFGFEELELNRIGAGYFMHNPASGRVQQKMGMRPEGVRRQNFRKWGEYVDEGFSAILRSEYEAARGPAQNGTRAGT